MTNPTPHGQVPEALEDFEVRKLAAIGAVRTSSGLVERRPIEYRRELENQFVRGFRAAEKRLSALSAAPRTPTVEQVEDEISMGHGAWDMVDPQELIGTVLRLSVAASPPAEQQAAPKAAPGEQFDPEGFRAWVLRNLPDDTIIGSSAWWADHLTTWAQRFMTAAPQQEAQEPAAWRLTNTAYRKPKYEYFEHKSHAEVRQEQFNQSVDDGGLHNLTPLYTAPQPAPAPLSDDVVKDAARYRFLAGHCRSTSEHWGGRWSIVVDGPAPKSHDSEDDFDEAVDAALAAQGGK